MWLTFENTKVKGIITSRYQLKKGTFIMVNKDYLIRAVDQDQQVRLILSHTTASVQEAHRRHQTSATASAAMGRVFSAALMMGSDLKGDKDSLTVRVDGGGISGPIVATVDSHGTGRVLISDPQADLPSKSPGKLAVGDLVGRDGFVEVIKDLGLKQPFMGTVPLVSGEIGEDMANYFLVSEQIPSLVSLGVLVDTDLSIKAAGGLFVQAMPGADDTVLEKLEQQILSLGPISYLLNKSSSLEEMLKQIMQDIPYKVVGEQLLQFKCNCGRDRLARIMASLSSEELQEIEASVGKLEVCCNFCREVYLFSRAEIEAIQKQKP
jgi:molecular chaperone Hsp33